MRTFPPILLLLAAVIAFSFSAKNQKDEPLDTNCSFWSIDYGSGITAWTFLDDSTLSSRMGPDISGGQSYDGLAYCKIKGQKRLVSLVDGEQNKRSLYTTPGTPFKIPVTVRNEQLLDLDGSGEMIYAYSYTAPVYSLVRIRDGQLSTIVKLKPNEHFLGGDIAVDSLGRAWVIVAGSSDYDYAGPHELRCFSPDGRIVTTVPVTGISSTNSYGMMLVKGKLYVAYGTDNRLYHDRLVQLDLSGDTLKPRLSIPFGGNMHDLASARPGVPVFPKNNR